MFEPGDLFLVYKQAGEGPVGFVGWQERQVGPEKVGFYAIGMLPQYRRQGLAKEAVSKLLADRAGRVDRLAALIAPGNTPSEALAKSLGIPKVSPNLKKASPWATAGKLLYGPATAALMDLALNKEKGAIGYAAGWHDNPWSLADYGKNLLANSASMLVPGLSPTAKVGIPAVGALTTSLSPGIREVARANDIAQKSLEAQQLLSEKPTLSLPMLAGAGLLAATGGLGALALSRALRNQGSRGKLKVTLPTRHPGDAETVVEIPYDQQQAMTEALRKRLEIDTKRRLYAETKERIRRRNPALLSDRGRLTPTNLEEP